MTVYFIRDLECGLIKIGYTRGQSAEGRLSTLQTANAHKLALIAIMEGGYPDESELHQQFAAHHVRGEWFRPAADLVEWMNERAGKRIDMTDRVCGFCGITTNKLYGNDGGPQICLRCARQAVGTLKENPDEREPKFRMIRGQLYPMVELGPVETMLRQEPYSAAGTGE